MANHRMFSYRIANSAKFLQMPAEAQLLYFHMILRADDDGVVEAYPLLKLLGTPSDVFKVLLAKKFIKELNEDQVVVIKEWFEHNKIRADRKVNSIYKDLLEKKNIEILAPKPRSDVKNNNKRLQMDSPRTDNGRHKLSKDKLSKDKLSKDKLDILSKEYILSELLLNLILQNTPTFKKPNLEKWTEEIDLMVRIDKRTHEQIEFIIKWCQQNDFWKANILSTKKLRKQFDTLVAQFKRDKNNNNNKKLIEIL